MKHLLSNMLALSGFLKSYYTYQENYLGLDDEYKDFGAGQQFNSELNESHSFGEPIEPLDPIYYRCCIYLLLT